jgi:hypothetical protein
MHHRGEREARETGRSQSPASGVRSPESEKKGPVVAACLKTTASSSAVSVGQKFRKHSAGFALQPAFARRLRVDCNDSRSGFDGPVR